MMKMIIWHSSGTQLRTKRENLKFVNLFDLLDIVSIEFSIVFAFAVNLNNKLKTLLINLYSRQHGMENKFSHNFMRLYQVRRLRNVIVIPKNIILLLSYIRKGVVF